MIFISCVMWFCYFSLIALLSWENVERCQPMKDKATEISHAIFLVLLFGKVQERIVSISRFFLACSLALFISSTVFGIIYEQLFYQLFSFSFSALCYCYMHNNAQLTSHLFNDIGQIVLCAFASLMRRARGYPDVRSNKLREMNCHTNARIKNKHITSVTMPLAWSQDRKRVWRKEKRKSEQIEGKGEREREIDVES